MDCREERINEIVAAAASRMKEAAYSQQQVMAEIFFMTNDELAELHDLKQSLHRDTKLEASNRIAQKIARRREARA